MGVKGRCQKRLVSQNLFFKEFVLSLLASTPVFHKKVNLIFVVVDVLFVDGRHILDDCRSQRITWDE